MNNSRRKLSRVAIKEDPKPTNSSRGRGLTLETPYHPGFVDDKDLETLKMAVDKELSEISNAFYETTEKTADTITRVDNIEISSGDILARINEVDRVSKEGDEALAQRITKVDASVAQNATHIVEETTARVNADGALGERITNLKAESDAGIAEVKQQMTVVSDKVGKVEAKWGVEVNVNGKISGVSLNNDGKRSDFSIIADRFTISNGDGAQTIPPFQVVGGHTRIQSAFINTLQSDNWDAARKIGWAITKEGNAYFNNVEIRGTLQAQDIQGDMGTEWRIATNDLSPNINVWTNLKNFNIINARPYIRQIIWDCGFVTNGNLATAESVFNLRIRHSSGTQIASGLVTVGVDYSLPMRMYGQIPANMAGACVAEVQKITSNGSIHGTDGTIRVFKYTNELS
ncbi:MAG: phage tail tip fiber protein [Fusobacteriaceae bacterium]